jgi:hypothetical protein
VRRGGASLGQPKKQCGTAGSQSIITSANGKKCSKTSLIETF